MVIVIGFMVFVVIIMVINLLTKDCPAENTSYMCSLGDLTSGVGNVLTAIGDNIVGIIIGVLVSIFAVFGGKIYLEMVKKQADHNVTKEQHAEKAAKDKEVAKERETNKQTERVEKPPTGGTGGAGGGNPETGKPHVEPAKPPPEPPRHETIRKK